MTEPLRACRVCELADESALTQRGERRSARDHVSGAGREHEGVGRGSDGMCGDHSDDDGGMRGEFEGSGEESGCGACRGSDLAGSDGLLEGENCSALGQGSRRG